LTGQRPADVLIMRSDDTEGDYFLVTQGKTGQKLRILMRTEAGENSLGRLVREIGEGDVALALGQGSGKSPAERHRTRRPAARGQDWRVSVPRHPAEGRVGNHRYR